MIVNHPSRQHYIPVSYFSSETEQKEELEKFPFKEELAALRAKIQSKKTTYERLPDKAYSPIFGRSNVLQFFIQLSEDPKEDATHLLPLLENREFILQVVSGMVYNPRLKIDEIEQLIQVILGNKRPTTTVVNKCKPEAKEHLEEALKKLAYEKRLRPWFVAPDDAPFIANHLYLDQLAKLHDEYPFTESHLTWEQLKKIRTSGLTLRHVETAEDARKEMREGADEDRYVVSLSKGVDGIITNFTLKDHEFKTFNFDQSANAMATRFQAEEKKLSAEDKSTIVKLYEKAIFEFIAQAFFVHNYQLSQIDALAELEPWTETRKVNLSQTASFLILHLPAHKPYDYVHNQYLGKFPDQFKPANYKKMILVPREILDETVPPATDSFTERVAKIDGIATKYVFNQVLDYLKQSIL